MVAMQRNADDVKSSEDLVEFSQRLITEDMSQQMFTYAFIFSLTDTLDLMIYQNKKLIRR